MDSPNSSKELLNLDGQLEEHGVHIEDDNKICWNEANQDHPRNWGVLAKTYSTLVICWLELYMTGISSSGTAAADSARTDYGISRTLAYFAFVTIYLLGQTIGGIFCSPISEAFGRRTIYIISTVMFCIFSAIVAAVPSLIAVFFGRFFQGVAAAIPATVAFGNFDDMFNAESRIWVVYGYTLAGMTGLAMGPIYSAYITEVLNWRWVFYISTIVSFISAVLCIFIKESNAVQLLQSRTKDISTSTGKKDLYAAGSDTKFSLSSFATTSLFRPLQFLFTEPIVFFCSILCAIAFGLIYSLTEGLTVTYTLPPFSNTFSQTSSSLTFIAILIGELLNILPRFYDQHVFRRHRSNRTRITPESKISSFALACPALALGLWLFAWTVPPRTNVPWPVSAIGLALIGFALNDFSYVLFGYVTDSYGQYAASGVAAISLTRTLAAAVFPLFSYQMFDGLGPNVAASILAGVATLFAFTPILFLRYGERLRGVSKWAVESGECLPEENRHMEDPSKHQAREC
ncbi:putative MFS multidrug transporter [Delphinella strobiligena]|nr:putative MFS multidrug transporter [Delphinella strobiligena]